MKTFFIFYWLTFFAGWWMVRNHQSQLRLKGRYVHAARHREQVVRQARHWISGEGHSSPLKVRPSNGVTPQLHLFE